MSAVLRLALVGGLLLLAGGTVVLPHDALPGWSHRQLDHPPAALQSSVLHLLHAAHPDQTPAAHPVATELAPPAALALAALTLAVATLSRARVWRPSPAGVHRPAALVGAPQLILAPPRLPPRASFPL